MTKGAMSGIGRAVDHQREPKPARTPPAAHCSAPACAALLSARDPLADALAIERQDGQRHARTHDLQSRPSALLERGYWPVRIACAKSANSKPSGSLASMRGTTMSPLRYVS